MLQRARQSRERETINCEDQVDSIAILQKKITQWGRN